MAIRCMVPYPIRETIDMEGRPWTAEELRQKSWNDLHILWYKCVMERNIMATERFEARKQKLNWYYSGKHVQREATVYPPYPLRQFPHE